MGLYEMDFVNQQQIEARWGQIKSQLEDHPVDKHGNYDGPTKEDKGKRNGSCNVTACQRPGANWYNKAMYAWYCPKCAGRINAANDKYGEERLCISEETYNAIYTE